MSTCWVRSAPAPTESDSGHLIAAGCTSDPFGALIILVGDRASGGAIPGGGFSIPGPVGGHGPGVGSTRGMLTNQPKFPQANCPER
jgi:hypothetical protein